jgi:cell division protease FtsH
MHRDAWLPVGLELPQGLVVRRVAHAGADWQIVGAQDGGHALVAKEELAERWRARGLIDDGHGHRMTFAGEKLLVFASGSGRALEPVDGAASPGDKSEALARASAFASTRRLDGESPLHDALYIERLSRLLPTFSLSAPLRDDVVVGKWLTGGVPVSVHAGKRLRVLLGWLGADGLSDVIAATGIGQASAEGTLASARTTFSIVGRPELEQFFRENVIDIVMNAARYQALGIDFPPAIVLHGPPGCGKTYAVERLIDHLGWPSFSIDAASVASPYIHDTSRKVSALFATAAEHAPAVLVIDEMEAFLSDRSSAGASGHHHVEEVAEFLRRIPEAGRKKVLVIGMTNKIEMIDAAILRRGRFDHVIAVSTPNELEIGALLSCLISKLPCLGSIDVETTAKSLAGRPLSDVAYIVRECARLAARAGKAGIDQESFSAAVAASGRMGEPERRVGFL